MRLSTLERMSDEEILARAARDPQWFDGLLDEFAAGIESDRREWQLSYYTPANPMVLGPPSVHSSIAREVALVGGNRSTKTDTMLAELAIQMTGHVPQLLRDVYPREKLRAPIRARIVCNSLVDTLEPIIKPKLRWDQWNGVGDPREGRGHWGWIPKALLKGGSWEKAYSEKQRTLAVAVDNYWGNGNSSRTFSTCQFMSYDQDLSAFAGSSMHFIGHDELPPQAIYRENKLRTLDVKGSLWTAFTPPDEAGASRGDVSYFFDEVYERGLPGPHQDRRLIETFVLHTEKNRIIDAQEITDLMGRLTPAQREVRLLGRFLHLSGVIYGDFTQYEAHWCFRCVRRLVPVNGTCPYCAGSDIVEFTHVVEPFPVPPTWPVVMVIDPHPRKPDAIGWFAVTPSDDVIMVGELEMAGTADDIVKAIKAFEESHHLFVTRRLMDPNIATETNDKQRRGWTIGDAYAQAGLRCALASDEMNTGISRVQEWLRPDRLTRRPRFQVFNSCPLFIKAMTRWAWDEWARNSDDRETKEKVRDRWKDFPDLVRYLANDLPSYGSLARGPQVFRRAR